MKTIRSFENFKPELNEREFTSAQREKSAKKKHALPDGSFPIESVNDLKNAISAFGRAKNKSAAAKHIAKRARGLGHADMIPDTDVFQKALKS
jgi:hypothetical protein